jgi:tRNA threonylcarbamoyladenosine biosynthesis protein TsaB
MSESARAMTKPILAIETTGKALSVALSRPSDKEHKGDGRLCENTACAVSLAMTGEAFFTQSDGSFGVASGDIVERRSTGELSHLTDLVPTIEELLESEGMTLASLGALAVSVGPGSFTGIRIGVSAARAIAQVTGLPVIAVPTLETFAFGFEPGVIVCPLLDARRGQFYCGAYRLLPGESGIETLVPGAARDPEAFDAALEAALPAAEHKRDGSLYEKWYHRHSERSEREEQSDEKDVSTQSDGSSAIRYVRDEDEPQSAVKVLKWARAFGEPADYAALEPLYMRKAEAQRRLDERLAAECEERAGCAEDIG